MSRQQASGAANSGLCLPHRCSDSEIPYFLIDKVRKLLQSHPSEWCLAACQLLRSLGHSLCFYVRESRPILGHGITKKKQLARFNIPTVFIRFIGAPGEKPSCLSCVSSCQLASVRRDCSACERKTQISQFRWVNFSTNPEYYTWTSLLGEVVSRSSCPQTVSSKRQNNHPDRNSFTSRRAQQ